MRRMISSKAQKYIKDLATNHPDPSAEWGGSDYTAGNGIDITDSEISIDDTVVATKTDLEDYELKADAFSGDYDDLTNKPDLSIYAESSDLATVATTGSYNDLTNKPTIPDAVSGTNDGTNWTSLTIGSDTYAIPQGGSSDDVLTRSMIGDSLQIANNKINVKCTTINPIKMDIGSAGLRSTLQYDDQALTLSKKWPNDPTTGPYSSNTVWNLNTQIGGGYKDLFLLDKTKINSTSSLSNYGTITQNEIVTFIKNAIINIIRSKQKPDTTSTRVLDLGFPKFNMGINNQFEFWFKVNYALTESGGDTIQITYSNTSITADGFSFYYSTGEVITDNISVYLTSEYITRILNADTTYVLFRDVIHAEDGQIVEQVDKKFIPLVSDIPSTPTTQGTYTLQVVVDQDGNPTFSWVLEV